MEILLVGHDGSNATKQRANALISAAPRALGKHERGRVWLGSHVAVALTDDGVDRSCPIWQPSDDGSRLLIGLTNSQANAARILKAPQHVAQFGAECPVVLVDADEDGSQLAIRTDGVGAMSGFFAELETLFLFSTSLHHLAYLGLPPELDPVGVATYLAGRHPFTGQTLLGRAHLLPPGATIAWRAGASLTISSRSLLRRTAPLPGARTKSDLVALFAETWPRVMQDLLAAVEGRLVLSLSGGLDSRTVARGLRDAGAAPVSFTYGSDEDREVRIASLVAEKLGMRHHKLAITPTTMLGHAEFSFNALDAWHSPFEFYQGWFRDEIASLGAVFANGTPGDDLWGSNTAGQTKADVILQKFRKYGRELNGVAPLLTPEFLPTAQQMLWDEVTANVNSMEDFETSDISSFSNWCVRQRAWVTSEQAAMRRSGIRIENPFFYSSFLEFARAVPGELRQNGRLYLAVYRRLYPELADIPRTLAPLPPRLIEDHLYRATVAERLRMLQSAAAREPLTAFVGSRFLAGEFILWLLKRWHAPEGIARPVRALLHEHRPVFRHRDWLHSDPTYRTRYLGMLEESISCAPDFVDQGQMRAALDQAHQGRLRADPMLVARVVSTCLWRRLWKTRAAESRRIARAMA